jgi:hypothetical protein
MKDEVSYVKGVLKHTIQEKQEHQKTISYSQFSMYQKCQRHWKLRYIDKNRDDLPNINLLFGTAMHEVLQTYLYEIYEGIGPGRADKMDLYGMLKQAMANEYVNLMERTGGEIFTEQSEMEEFYKDGVAILEFVRKNRRKYFSTNGYELIAIEMPIFMRASEHNENVYMNGFVDVILRNKITNKYIIYDIKTSTNGWNKWMKADKTKTSQLVIYKKYFAEQIGCDIKDIDVQYFIVRRKIPEDSMYPIRPVSEFSPSSGKPTINKVMTDVDSFVKSAFNEDGTHNTERNYLAIGGKGLKHCKYCPFKDNEELCPKTDRIRE